MSFIGSEGSLSSRMEPIEVAIAGKSSLEDSVPPPRKKLRITDLPLNSAQRTSIDNLLHTIKKNGEFDLVRKRVWSQYAESVSSRMVMAFLICQLA